MEEILTVLNKFVYSVIDNKKDFVIGLLISFPVVLFIVIKFKDYFINKLLTKIVGKEEENLTNITERIKEILTQIREIEKELKELQEYDIELEEKFEQVKNKLEYILQNGNLKEIEIYIREIHNNLKSLTSLGKLTGDIETIKTKMEQVIFKLDYIERNIRAIIKEIERLGRIILLTSVNGKYKNNTTNENLKSQYYDFDD
jgi:DNA-binding FrmR family transcriptional regulator